MKKIAAWVVILVLISVAVGCATSGSDENKDNKQTYEGARPKNWKSGARTSPGER